MTLFRLFAAFPTWEPFLLPGKLMMSVFPRIPHTGLQRTNTGERFLLIQGKKSATALLDYGDVCLSFHPKASIQCITVFCTLSQVINELSLRFVFHEKMEGVTLCIMNLYFKALME